MKVFAISDLHLSTVAQKPMHVFGSAWENYIEKISADWQQKVSKEDVVLLAGDFSWAMNMEEALPDLDIIAKLNGKKVLLRGNHDFWWNTISQVRNNLPEDMFALQNDCLRFENLLICGTRGWICPDGDNMTSHDTAIYLRERERLLLSLNSMQKQRKPTDTVIAMMHFPPFNGRYEDSIFTEQLIKYDIPTVVYGHIHGKDSRVSLQMKKFGIEFFLTSCDLLDNKLALIAEI